MSRRSDRRLFRFVSRPDGVRLDQNIQVGKLKTFFILIARVAILALLPATAAFPQTQSAEQSHEDISKTVSPGKAKQRFFLRNEFREREDGTHINILEALYDLPLTDKLVLRTQVPHVTNNPPEGPTVNGLGDITNVLYYRYSSGGGKSYFVGVEAKWNTARNPKLGTGKNLMAPTWFASISLPEHDTILFPLIQRFFTISGDPDRQDLNYTLIKPRWLTKLKNRYYYYAEPQIYIDHENNNETTGNLELELGRFVTPQTMAYVRPGVGLWGETDSPYLFEWNFEIGMRYFFR